RILAIRVVRTRPSLTAAPLRPPTAQFVSRSVEMMGALSASARVRPVGMKGRGVAPHGHDRRAAAGTFFRAADWVFDREWPERGACREFLPSAVRRSHLVFKRPALRGRTENRSSRSQPQFGGVATSDRLLTDVSYCVRAGPSATLLSVV